MNEQKNEINKNWGLDQDNTNEKLWRVIMLDLWRWKLILKEIERINWYGVSIKLWLGLINDIRSLIEEWISLT
jgi:hypothetical protein